MSLPCKNETSGQLHNSDLIVSYEGGQGLVHVRVMAPDSVMRPCSTTFQFQNGRETPRATAIFPKKQCDLGISSGWCPNHPPVCAPPLPTPPSPNCAVVTLSLHHTSPFPHATPMTRSVSTLQIRRTVGNDGSRPQCTHRSKVTSSSSQISRPSMC